MASVHKPPTPRIGELPGHGAAPAVPPQPQGGRSTPSGCQWLWLQISEIPDCLAIAIGPRSIPSATDTDGGLLYCTRSRTGTGTVVG
eukprot:COSAG01_NODE_1870_length_9013_cov_4.865268_5_plen_87_part_00